MQITLNEETVESLKLLEKSLSPINDVLAESSMSGVEKYFDFDSMLFLLDRIKRAGENLMSNMLHEVADSGRH